MAAIGQYALTLADWMKRQRPDGTVDDVIELSRQINLALEYIVWVEGNLPTGHRSTQRTDMPGITWTGIGQGVVPGKSGTSQVDDTFGKAEALSQIPRDLCELNGNTAEFRLSENIPFIDAINNDVMRSLFYSDSAVNVKEPLGLSARYGTLATSNVVNAGGSGSDVTSMWLTGWGPSSFHGIFPKGQKAGIIHEPAPAVMQVSDGATPPGYIEVYQDWYKWHVGWCLRDWRYVVRLANIEVTGAANMLDLDLMVDAMNLIPNPGMVNLTWMVNRYTKAQLDKLAMNKANAALSFGEVFGQPVTAFWGVPIIRCDALLATETALV